MNSRKSGAIKNHRGTLHYLALELNGIGMFLREEKSDVCLVLQDLLHGALVANSKLCSDGVKKMVSNNNNKKINLVQMDPEAY